MKKTLMYSFAPGSLEYTGSRLAQTRPNGKPVLESAYATPVRPGPEKEGFIQVYRANDAIRWPHAGLTLETARAGRQGEWYYIEDHRQHTDEKGGKQGGTPFWLPTEGDDWFSPERYLEKPGPLPDGAVLQRPKKPRPTADELADAVRAERDRRLATTDKLMFPDSTINGLPLTEEERQALLEYRQALKTLPSKPGFPWKGGGRDDETCPWPQAPVFLSGKEVM